MSQKVQERLISVKSIITIAIVGVFCYLAIVGKIDSEHFMTVLTTIIAFYFGTQHEKKGKDK